jgi:hypothetical protein
VCFVAVEVVKFARAIARVLKRIEIGAGRRATFETGVAISFVVREMASIHLEVRSMIVKKWLQPVLYCKEGPPGRCGGEQTAVEGRGWAKG